MAIYGLLCLLYLGVLTVTISTCVPTMAAALTPTTLVNHTSLKRSSFPKGFIFGTGSASYKYEGAANEGGRGQSGWDKYTHEHPENILDGSNGDVAVDQYHRYKEDVAIMKYMNTDAYRFSISWPRILPKGKVSAGINQEGIKYYNNLINELLDNGLVPFVTLFHWDLPQALQDEYSGFLSPYIINDFQDYAELCFKEFGDRVKHWITFNDPHVYSLGSEPYMATHNQLLAHAAAVKIYRTNHQSSQNGSIGISLSSHWFLPFSNHTLDHQAAERALDYMFGWFMQPLTTGEYPLSMVSFAGNRLPKFTKEQSKMLIGSFDFIGINYYTSKYAANIPQSNSDTSDPSYLKDTHVKFTTERNGIPIGPMAASPWLFVYPRGIQELLLHTKTKYNNPLIYITENGMDELNDPTLSLEEALMDTYRIDYFYRHLYYVSSAIKHGVKVQGYFAWSLLDNFEWLAGYTRRFGMNYVNYNDNLKRHQKLSAHWFRNFLKKH
ncbi:putative beta-glucosidase [Medicago truncatula]|uniref:Glycoside hydrolase family 1 protein n=1 Tax=Medicago truncatula TaxID=3880 RepID=A0A072UKP2_MEDTR|nr:beta-glucosidase 12 [Medicago truncatula]KEH30282.1 glycoside hydrolase family 1 protein [Medicago truncatula]RHN61122.1 putative beta-glucosidase [Medicago truncatula]